MDLGGIQAITAVNTYSWHDFADDQGARGPQVYSVSGRADSNATWTKIADVTNTAGRVDFTGPVLPGTNHFFRAVLP